MKIKHLSWILLTLFIITSYGCEVEKDNTPIKTYIYDVSPSSWSGNIDGFSTYLEVPEITSKVFYNGTIFVYRILNEDTKDASLCQLPYTWVDHNAIEYMDYNAYVGGIDIQLKNLISGINQTPTPSSNYTFKIVIVDSFELPDVED